MRASLVAPSCKGDTEGLRACGLLAVEWAQPAFLDSFRTRNCPDGLTDECRERLRVAFDGELATRYHRASRHDIAARCLAETDCGAFDAYEIKWLESHNARVFATARHALEQRAEHDAAQRAERERELARVRADEARMRAISAAVAGAAAGMQRGLSSSSSCTNSYGCVTGYTCLIPSGESSGTCVQAR